MSSLGHPELIDAHSQQVCGPQSGSLVLPGPDPSPGSVLVHMGQLLWRNAHVALGHSPASSHAGGKCQIAAIYFAFLGVKWMKICPVMHHRQAKSHETSADGHLINVTDVPWQGPKHPALQAAVCVG